MEADHLEVIFLELKYCEQCGGSGEKGKCGCIANPVQGNGRRVAVPAANPMRLCLCSGVS